MQNSLEYSSFKWFFNRWGDVIANYCGQKSKAEILSKATDDGLWVTILVIVLIEALIDQEDLWELVVKKARKYLDLRLDKKEQERLENEAKTFIKE